MSFKSVFRPGLLKGCVYIVTGAGSGIGRCTAHELTNLGATVALIGRKIEKLEIVEKEITNVGGTTSIHSCDIRDEPNVVNLVKDILAKHGRIDGLVNNAGGQFQAPLKSISLKGWDAVVKTNLTGGFLISRECYNQYMHIHGGSIVNIIADMWNGMPMMGHSGAARAGMLNFTETAALEWAPVRVNAVAPGFINSSGFDQYPEAVRKAFNVLPSIVPLKRVGTESEVSSVITFLLSPAANFISGELICFMYIYLYICIIEITVYICIYRNMYSCGWSCS